MIWNQASLLSLFVFGLKTVPFWHSGIEFRPGLQSLRSFDPPLFYFCSLIFHLLFSSSLWPSQFRCLLPSLFYLLWFPEVQDYRLASQSDVVLPYSCSEILSVLFLLRPCPHICGYKTPPPKQNKQINKQKPWLPVEQRNPSTHFSDLRECQPEQAGHTMSAMFGKSEGWNTNYQKKLHHILILSLNPVRAQIVSDPLSHL